MSVLSAEAEQFIIEYMNMNHLEVNRTIVQIHGGIVDATAAQLTALNDLDAVFTVDGNKRCVVRWPRPLVRRENVRQYLFELYETALDEISHAGS